MTNDMSDLAAFGWTNHFQSQLDADEWGTAVPVRVMAVHRSGLDVAGPGIEARGLRLDAGAEPEDRATVGDWLLLDPETRQPIRRLERHSLFKRRAAGVGREVQLIAANVDTLFVVTSCNQDFNIARLERYLALAGEAGVTPLIVLTKADQVDDPGPFIEQARDLMTGVLVETVDGRDPDSVAVLAPWCGRGQTVALLGSSGVGKTTLVNSMMGTDLATAAIREDDAKGRHTTTGRAMYRLAGGGWVIDTPGMRELQLTDVADGLDDVFAEIAELATGCRFSDCAHETEPGCAVRAALEAGDLEPARLERYRKLVREEAHNRSTLHERRERGRQFGKMVRNIMAEKHRGR